MSALNETNGGLRRDQSHISSDAKEKSRVNTANCLSDHDTAHSIANHCKEFNSFFRSRNRFTLIFNLIGGQFKLTGHKSDMRSANKCLLFARAFTEKGSGGGFNLLAV